MCPEIGQIPIRDLSAFAAETMGMDRCVGRGAKTVNPSNPKPIAPNSLEPPITKAEPICRETDI